MTRSVALWGPPLFGLLLLPISSAASTIYPNTLERGVGLAAAPECTLCHTTNRGGSNTATRPFAQTLVSLGLEGGANATALEAAVLAAEADRTDSDGGGVADIDELLLATDPNGAEDDAGEAPAPTGEWFGGAPSDGAGGCRTSPATSPRGWLELSLALAATAYLARRARRAIP